MKTIVNSGGDVLNATQARRQRRKEIMDRYERGEIDEIRLRAELEADTKFHRLKHGVSFQPQCEVE